MTATALDHEFANEVVAGGRAERRYARRGWLLVGLLLCCLGPRVWMAWRLDTLCNDAVFYIEHAQGIERGDLEAGLGRLRLNVYPPVLATLHSWGLGWELAGKIWGVALASLTVLPLFGWLRRQFDETLAVVGCLLYAFHPRLIECSPELIRDPTFWFFWTLGLYTSWRAAAETRLPWYLLSGLTIALAIHTRFEGWFLYLPLVGWSVCRCGRRLRAAAGCAAAIVVCPLLILAINLSWLIDQPRWELGNFDRLQYVALWSQATWRIVQGEPPSDAMAATESDLSAENGGADAAPAPVSTAPRIGIERMLWTFVNALRRGFGALFGLCWLAGFASRPRLWLRRDHAVLFLVAGCVAAGTWIHLWYAQATSSRYFLAMVLLGIPCAAAGCQWACRRTEQVLRWIARLPPFAQGEKALSFAIVAVVVVMLTGSMAETFASNYEGRRREAALGRWILTEFGPRRSIVTPKPLGLLGFYAQATTHALSTEPAALDGNADLAVVSPDIATPKQAEAFVDAASRHRLRPIDPILLPEGHDWSDVVVMRKIGDSSTAFRIPHSALRTF